MDKSAIGALANLVQALNRIGKSGDAAGINTLFAHLAELESRLTASRAGKLDLIGATADAAGTGSLFAYLKRLEAFVDALESDTALIKGYVDALETDTGLIKGYTDSLEGNVGSNADASSSTGSAHAKLKDLRALVDTLEGSLGQTGDAASATGTAQAKIKDVKNSLGNTGDAASATGTVNAKIKELRAALAGLVWGNGTRTLTSLPSIVNSIQRGVTSVDGDAGELQVTISAVDLAKAFVASFGSTANGTSARGINVRIINSTTIGVTGTYDNTSSNLSVYWEIAELK